MQKRRTEESLSKKLKNLYSEGATMIPWTILRCPTMRPQVKACHSLIASYSWFGDCYPSQATLAKDLSVSTRTIRTYLNELKDLDLIEWVKMGPDRTNLYKLKDIPENHNFYRVRKEDSSPVRKESTDEVYTE